MKIEDAVLLAGENSRKKILGLPVLLRAILSAHRAGVQNFLIIGKAEDDENFIESIKSDDRVFKNNLTINFLSLQEDKAGQKEIPYPLAGKFYWLIDGNLIFDEEILIPFQESPPENERKIIFFWPQTTLQITEDKNHWPGLALCPQTAWPSLLLALQSSETSEKDQVLLDKAFQDFWPEWRAAEDKYFIRVDSKAKEKEAIQCLLQTARKPLDGFIARHINRHISLFFSRYLINLGLSSTSLSIINFLFGVAGAVFASLGRGYWSFLIGGLLFEFSSIFDGCDGEAARLTYQTSEKGATFDVIFDALTYLLFFSGLAIGLYRASHRSLYLVLLGLFLLSLAWYYFNLYRYTRASGIGNKIFLVAKEVETKPKKEGKLSFFDRLASKLAFAVRRDFFATIVFLMMAAGGASIIVFLVIIGSLIESTYFHFFTCKEIK